VEMNLYILSCHSHHLSAKFLCRALPVSNSAPSAPPKRRPQTRNSLHSDLQIPNIQFGPSLLSPSSSATATPPFLFFFALTPGPATLPPRPSRTAHRPRPRLCFAVATFRHTGLRHSPTRPLLACLTHLPSFDRCHTRRHSYVVCF
jgi:hypothetical protein